MWLQNVKVWMGMALEKMIIAERLWEEVKTIVCRL